MHIGFDVSQTGAGKAGCGYFAHAMARAMIEQAPEHRFALYPSFGDHYFDALMPLVNPYRGRHVHYGPRHLSRQTAKAFWSRPDLEAALGSPDVVHANNYGCPANLTSSRLIYTFYDMSFALDPSWTTEPNRVACFEGVFKSAVLADWVLAISQASRAHYLSVFPHFPPDRIRVIYPCSRFVDAGAVGKRPKALAGVLAGGFWLNVGTIEPRKNQQRLAQAYARYLALGGAPMPLVLAGGKGWLMESFQKQLDELNISAHVLMTGYVSDEELIWLYRNCYANLYPSLFEGFGLPVLEGMQFGAPTVASNSSSIPEIVANAGILLAPEDTEGWAQAMLRLSVQPSERHQLSQAARLQAARFQWQQSAAQLLQLYKDALSAPKRQGVL